MARKESIEIRRERNRQVREEAARLAKKKKTTKIIVAVVCALIVIGSVAGHFIYKSMSALPQYEAKITVKDYGTITLTLDPTYAPITVKNFVSLAEEGFYDGLTFHRILKGFMIQGGDPEHDGTGDAGKDIKGEFEANGVVNPLKHTRGVISMARGDDYNTASCQFFICDSTSTHLDGQYAAFGWVTDGMDIVDKIAADAKPIDDNGSIAYEQQPVIESITVKPLS